jgi:hypothetical protein
MERLIIGRSCELEGILLMRKCKVANDESKREDEGNDNFMKLDSEKRERR